MTLGAGTVRRLGAAVAVTATVLATTAACGRSDDPPADTRGVDVTTATGLEIAAWRVGSTGPDPYPEGATAPVLARIVGTREGDRLLGATSPAARSVVLVGRDGRPTPALEVPAIPPGEPLDLTLDGPHLELWGLRSVVRGGDRVVVALRFERAGEVRADIPRWVSVDNSYPP